MHDREGRQQCDTGVLVATETLLVVVPFLWVHRHAVADTACLGCLLLVLLICKVEGRGLATCLFGVGEVVSASLALRAGGRCGSWGRTVHCAVVREVQVHVGELLLAGALNSWVSAG